MGLGKSLKKIGKKIGKALKKTFKKIAKVTGIDKVFKTVKKWVKSGLKAFGKFMGKIGVVGQIAMMFILPGVGNALMGALGSIGQAAAASSNWLVQGAAKLGSYAMKAVKTAGNVFKNVTGAVKNTLGNFSKALGNKIGITNTGPKNLFFGEGSAFDLSMKEGQLRFKNVFKNPDTFMGEMDKVVDSFKADTPFKEVPPTQSMGDKLEYIDPSEKTRIFDAAPDRIINEGKVGEFKVKGTSLLDKPPTAESFGSTLKEAAGTLKDKAIQGIKDAPSQLVQKALDAPSEAFDTYVDTAAVTAAQKSVLGDDYMTPVTNVEYGDSYATYVPAIEQAQMNVYDFGAGETMNARAFETNILQSPMPYGNTAYQYQQGYQNYFSNFA